MIPLFAAAYYIARENLAILKYESFYKLMDFLDVD